MIGTLLFVLAFVAVGLAVVVVAFSGGPRGVAQRKHRAPSLIFRRAFSVVVLVLIAGLGVAVPTLVSVANGTDHARESRGGVQLTENEQRGRAIFAAKCATCHTLAAANAVGKVGPNLDVLLGVQTPSKELVLNAIENGLARGQGQMPSGLVDGEDAEHVADFIVAVAGR